MQFKEKYIVAFNEMERKIQTSLLPSNYIDALKALIVEVETNEVLIAQNAVLSLTAAKYEGQTDTVGLYKVGEIAEELGTTAVTLNRFLKEKGIQYRPNGSSTWRLYADYVKNNIASPKIVTLDNGYEQPMLL